MKDVSLSIIVTVRSGGAGLSSLLQSIAAQSVQTYEIICLHLNGSPVEMQDSRIRQIVAADGQTPAQLRNQAIQKARGEYIHFIEDNCTILDYAYEALMNKMERYEADIIRFSVIPHDAERKADVRMNHLSLYEVCPAQFNKRWTDKDNDLRNSYHPLYTALLLRKSFLEKEAIRFSEDHPEGVFLFYYDVLASGGVMSLSRDRLFRMNLDNKKSEQLRRETSFLAEEFSVLLKKYRDDELFVAGIRNAMVLECRDWLTQFEHQLSKMKWEEADKTLAALEQQWIYLDYAVAQKIYRRIKQDRKILENQKDEPERKLPQIRKNKYALQKVVHERVKKPKVSVIIPLYNQEDYLNQALFSLTTQMLEEMEFIVVNDGSTDRSLTIYQAYAALDKRFSLIDKDNTGYGHSMNLGIDAARGEYIGILEPDDYVPAEMYKDLYQVAAPEKLDLVKADFYRFTDEDSGKERMKRTRLAQDDGYYERLIAPAEDPKSFFLVSNTWSGIYRRIFIQKNNIRHNETPGASFQDNGFWFQTFCFAQKARFLRKPYYKNRRDNPNSSVYSNDKIYAFTKEYTFIYAFMERHRGFIEKYDKVFYHKKLENMLLTYRRIDETQKNEYLQHLLNEFREPYESGKLLAGEEETEAEVILREMQQNPQEYQEHIKVSIIIPVYNATPYLKQCLDSFLCRNELSVEVICIDDGSSDESLQILQQYAEQDARLIVLTQENAGAGAARNRGLKIAKGEYLAFFDADDFFEPEVLWRTYARARYTDADVVVFRSDQFLEDEQQYCDMPHTIKRKWLPDKECFSALEVPYDFFNSFVGWPWDKLFKASYIKETQLQFQEQRTNNDLLFVYAALAKAERITVMRAVLAHHRRLPPGESLSVSREKSWDCFYKALIALREQLQAWGLFAHYERDFVNYALHFSLWNLNTLQGQAFQELYVALKEVLFDTLGIAGRSKDYFYREEDYKEYQDVCSVEADEYRALIAGKQGRKIELARVEQEQLRGHLEEESEARKRAEKRIQHIQENKGYKIGSRLIRMKRKLSGK